MSKIVIVGGGVVGLFTAWYLQKSGAEVTVVERTDLHDGCSFGNAGLIVGRVEDLTTVGDFPAIIPSIEGWAKITGYNNILIDDEDDPYAHGFQVI